MAPHESHDDRQARRPPESKLAPTRFSNLLPPTSRGCPDPTVNGVSRQRPTGPNQANHSHAAESRTTIYDVARVAGVATSTVSRALSAVSGRVSCRTAEHVRRVAEDLRYRTATIQSPAPERPTSLAMVVADIANPNFSPDDPRRRTDLCTRRLHVDDLGDSVRASRT